jgi:hypothetical protein
VPANNESMTVIRDFVNQARLTKGGPLSNACKPEVRRGRLFEVGNFSKFNRKISEVGRPKKMLRPRLKNLPRKTLNRSNRTIYEDLNESEITRLSSNFEGCKNLSGKNQSDELVRSYLTSKDSADNGDRVFLLEESYDGHRGLSSHGKNDQ